MQTLDEIYNERLLLLYGREQVTDQQKYRLVRSERQTEKRYGSYDVVSQETGIYVGTKQGLVEIKKYWYFPDCWLLERVEPNRDRKDTIHEPFTYEPLFPFLSAENLPLPLEWKAIEFLLNRLEHAEKQFKTEQDHFAEREKEIKTEEERDFGIIDAPEPVKELPTFSSSTLLDPVNVSKLR